MAGISPSRWEDGRADERNSARHDELLRDVTIIQAQAQLLLRRLDAGRSIDRDDVHRRLSMIVEATQAITARSRRQTT